MRVLAALSGGVDSAVAAARAVDAGHEVVGVHMALSRSRAQFRTGSRGCCSIEDAGDARRAADRLGIPFYVWDLSERFEDTVVADFLAEYAAGRTPNPCVRCNEHIKFATLLDKALALGFDAVCTGHYARVVGHDDGSRELHRAADLAAWCHADSLAARASAELASTGLPRRALATHDADSLTVRELTVAERAADGWPNDRISADLRLGTRRVKALLSSVYAKLGTDRGGLGYALGSTGNNGRSVSR